jgi:hypothetical protein
MQISLKFLWHFNLDACEWNLRWTVMAEVMFGAIKE